MTVWKAGMLAVCVAVPHGPIGAFWQPEVGGIYCVVDVDTEGGYPAPLLDFAEDPDKFNPDGAWGAEYFRPAVLGDTEAGRSLIALLDAPAPVRIPHLEPLSGYPSNDQPSGAPSHASAGDRADDPTRRPCSLAHGQASKDGGEQVSQLGSVFHDAANISGGQDNHA